MSASTGMGIHVSEATKDPQYDELKARLTIVPKNVEAFKKTYKRVCVRARTALFIA